MVVVLMCLVSVISGCGGDDKPADDGVHIERIGKSITKGDPNRGLVVASAQRSVGTSVLIDRVVLPRDGYVVVYADGAGAPGQRLGVSRLLDRGTAEDVVVTLSEKLSKDTIVHAMLHREDNHNTSLDFPKHDSPLLSGGSIVEAAFKVMVR